MALYRETESQHVHRVGLSQDSLLGPWTLELHLFLLPSQQADNVFFPIETLGDVQGTAKVRGEGTEHSTYEF